MATRCGGSCVVMVVAEVGHQNLSQAVVIGACCRGWLAGGVIKNIGGIERERGRGKDKSSSINMRTSMVNIGEVDRNKLFNTDL